MSLPTGIISSSRELDFTLVMGIYFSGSGFLVDLIQKQNVEDPLSGLEYLLPQLGGGIFDLENAVRNVRTPNCQTIAYKRFIDLWLSDRLIRFGNLDSATGGLLDFFLSKL